MTKVCTDGIVLAIVNISDSLHGDVLSHIMPGVLFSGPPYLIQCICV